MNGVWEALAEWPWRTIVDWTGAVALALGVLLTVVAAIGLVRFPDTLSRMHAASKPQLVGLVLVCVGICLDTLEWRWVVLSAVVIALQVVTAPVGSQLVARSVVRTGRTRDVALVEDDLSEDLGTSSTFDGS